MRIGVRDIEKLKNIGILKEYSKNSYIFKQNDCSKEMYILISGEVELTIGEGNNLVQLAKLEKGDILGEMAALENMPRCATARAKTECKLFLIYPNEFENLFEELPRVGARISRKLSSRLRQTNEELWIMKNSK